MVNIESEEEFLGGGDDLSKGKKLTQDHCYVKGTSKRPHTDFFHPRKIKKLYIRFNV